MSTVSLPVTRWNAEAATWMLDTTACPVCGTGRLDQGCCARCGADLRGDAGSALWQASQAAAAALRARDELVRTVPRVAAPAAPTAVPVRLSTPPRGPSATVQSILAIAGASLVAIAAVVFTFLNPDVQDAALRTAIIAITTVVFAVGVRFLARRGLTASAEAVASLAVVFVGLTIHAIAGVAATDTARWLIGAVGTAVAASALIVGARRWTVRAWMAAGLLGLAVTPAFAGYAATSGTVALFGQVGGVWVALGLRAALPWLLGSGWPSVGLERGVIAALQIVVTIVTVPALWLFGAPLSGGTHALILALLAAHALLATRYGHATGWSAGAGILSVLAAVLAPISWMNTAWVQPAMVATVMVVFVLIAAARLPRAVSREAVLVAALAASAIVLLPHVGFALVVGGATTAEFVFAAWGAVEAPDEGALVQLAGLGIAALGLTITALFARRRSLGVASTLEVLAVLFATATVLVATCLPLMALPARLVLVLAALLATAVVLPRTGRLHRGARIAVWVALHLAGAVAIMVSWSDAAAGPPAAIGVVAAFLAVAGAAHPGIRFVYVAAAFAYAQLGFGFALAQAGLQPVATLSLVTTAALGVALAATFVSRITARIWRAMLAVAVVPFALGIAQVIVERSAWTALSTAAMFALALTLLFTRRAGLTRALRTLAAGMLVPALAVVVVCLGAALLAGSASPVTLPIIAALVAAVLATTPELHRALSAHPSTRRTAAPARWAVEVSAVVTATIAVALALVRPASGVHIALIVLLTVAVGAGVAGLRQRRYAWWVMGASLTGAMWCVGALVGVDTLEAYTLPPAIAAMVAAIAVPALARRRLVFAGGVVAAVVPTLFLLVVTEEDVVAATVTRTMGLLVLAAVLTLAGWRSVGTAVHRIAPVAFIGAHLAGLGAVALAVRIGFGIDAAALAPPATFALCLALALAAAGAMAAAGYGLLRTRSPRRRSVVARGARWTFAPAVIAASVALWPAIDRNGWVVAGMWLAMAALLALMVTAAYRARRTLLPPVWLLFALAFATAVVAWSPRDLRVECFSLPLGAALLLAGFARGLSARRATLTQWPAGAVSSWTRLAPGLIVMMSASIVATFTDPLTWRAVLVMVLALGAILIGARSRLAAPFLIGMIVLPVENVFVFSVQIGRGIQSMPWWITLAVVGAVLLILAVGYERRTDAASGAAARLRDLA